MMFASWRSRRRSSPSTTALPEDRSLPRRTATTARRTNGPALAAPKDCVREHFARARRARDRRPRRMVTLVSTSLDFDVHAIAAGGDGVGRAGDLVVFAPRTAPGDRIRARVKRAKRFGRAIGVEIIHPSSERVTPPCPHYVRDACGGCQLQHLSDEAQARAKSAIIHDAFLRIAKRDIPAPEIRRGA